MDSASDMNSIDNNHNIRHGNIRCALHNENDSCHYKDLDTNTSLARTVVVCVAKCVYIMFLGMSFRLATLGRLSSASPSSSRFVTRLNAFPVWVHNSQHVPITRHLYIQNIANTTGILKMQTVTLNQHVRPSPHPQVATLSTSPCSSFEFQEVVLWVMLWMSPALRICRDLGFDVFDDEAFDVARQILVCDHLANFELTIMISGLWLWCLIRNA